MKRVSVPLVIVAVALMVFVCSSNFARINKKGYNFQLAKLPKPLMMPQVVQAKGKFYLFSQSNFEGFRKKYGIANKALLPDSQIAVYEFNPSAGGVRKIADAGFGRCFFGACYYGGKFYIAGGYDSHWKPTKTCFEFDLSSKKWVEKNPMFVSRASFALECSEGFIYALGGEGTDGSAEIFDPLKDQWELADTKHIPSILKPVTAIASSAVIDKKIFLIGTQGSAFQIFDPAGPVLSEGPMIRKKSDYYSSVVYNKRLYIAGGVTDSAIIDRVYMYDQSEGIWSAVGKIPVPRYGSGLVYYNGMLFYLGGTTSNKSQPAEPTDEIFIYRPMK
jgi:hypothetical protein